MGNLRLMCARLGLGQGSVLRQVSGWSPSSHILRLLEVHLQTDCLETCRGGTQKEQYQGQNCREP
jgi:hypothetical protein